MIIKVITGLVFLSAVFFGIAVAEEKSDIDGDQLSGKNTGEHKRVTFEELLKEGQLEFNTPEEFSQIQPPTHNQLIFDYALRSRDNQVEIFYMIRPLSRIEIDYSDPHNAAPDPNHIFPLIFDSMVSLMSDGRDIRRNEYRTEDAKEKFGAHWAAAAIFDTNPGFSKNYSQALMVAIHANYRADAYMLFLFNDINYAANKIKSATGSMRFRPSIEKSPTKVQ